jgi:hypothetical protein
MRSISGGGFLEFLMADYPLGTVIARRTFEYGENNLMLEIGAPYPVEGHADYLCPYRINGLGEGRVVRIGGVDSMQALFLAMRSAAGVLYAASAGQNDKITWLGQRNLGLPFPKDFADLVPPEDE